MRPAHLLVTYLLKLMNEIDGRYAMPTWPDKQQPVIV